jgi:hypothetical protein
MKRLKEGKVLVADEVTSIEILESQIFTLRVHPWRQHF